MACGVFHKATKSFGSKVKGFFKDFGKGFQMGTNIATKALTPVLDTMGLVDNRFKAVSGIVKGYNGLVNLKKI